VLVIFTLEIGGCGTFYAITIASKAFKGIPVVKQHRLVNEVLKKEIEGIHGLQVQFTLFLSYPLPYLHIDALLRSKPFHYKKKLTRIDL
jgi:acid stress-induced BolA-like protein IbaG/YrbA